MEILDKIKYIIEINKDMSIQFGIIDIVKADKVTGRKQCNDFDEDYFDHYYIESNCWEGLCSGVCFYPLDNEDKEYIEVEWYD